MAKRKRGQIDYIKEINSSSMLYFRYQWPKDIGGGERLFSLHTRDKKIARERAAVHLIECVKHVEEVRARRNSSEKRHPVTTLDRKMEPGTYAFSGGVEVVVTDETYEIRVPGLHPMQTPNLVRRVTDPIGWTLAEYMARVETDTLHETEIGGEDCPGWRGEPVEIPPHVQTAEDCRAPADGGIKLTAVRAKLSGIKRRSTPDDELSMHVERWASEGHKPVAIIREARNVMLTFQQISDSKPLNQCGRADGIELREYLFDLGQSTQTVQKKLGLLAAALTFSKKHYEYEGPNPFAGLVTKQIKWAKRDAVKGIAFTDEDMAKVRAALPTWNDPECVLLWVLCATTGMRRGEAFLIEREERFGAGKGLRCIHIVPTKEDDSIKNEDSVRTIPIPADAIPYLPTVINGRLFTGTPKNVGKRLIAKLRKLEITGPGKTLKSTRHRAAKRLHNAKLGGQYCPDKLRYEILGHERGERPVADLVYAGLYRPEELKPWIDIIGLGPTHRTA